MVDADGILEKLSEILAINEDIESFCQEKYQKSPTIFVGINTRNLPRKEQYPIIVIFDIERDKKGENQKTVEYVIDIAIAVIQEETEFRNDGKVVFQLGKKEVEQLRRLVEKAIYESGIATIANTLGQTLKEDIFPLFRTDTQVTLSFKRSSRVPLR